MYISVNLHILAFKYGFSTLFCLIPVLFQSYSCGIQWNSCHSCRFLWIPLEWQDSCRNRWGTVKYCPDHETGAMSLTWQLDSKRCHCSSSSFQTTNDWPQPWLPTTTTNDNHATMMRAQNHCLPTVMSTQHHPVPTTPRAQHPCLPTAMMAHCTWPMAMTAHHHTTYSYL